MNLKRTSIVLTSAGFKVPTVAKEIINRLPKLPKDTKLAHIFTASNVAPNTEYVKQDKEAIKSYGFQITDITLEGKSGDELLDLLKEQDIIYVQGGNGFYLLRHIRESGFDNVVKKLLDKGTWYIGVSAGTYVCCPTIEMHNWKRVSSNWYGITDLTGMNLVPFLVTAHYDPNKYREVIAANIPKASAPVKVLTNEQALFIQADKLELIGEGPEITASDIMQPPSQMLGRI